MGGQETAPLLRIQNIDQCRGHTWTVSQACHHFDLFCTWITLSS